MANITAQCPLGSTAMQRGVQGPPRVCVGREGITWARAAGALAVGSWRGSGFCSLHVTKPLLQLLWFSQDPLSSQDFSSQISSLTVANQVFLLWLTAKGFSPSPSPHATAAGSIKPAQNSRSISRHSTGTEPRQAVHADPATNTDSK